MAKSDSKKEIKPEPTPIPKVEAQPAPLLKEEDYPTDDKFVHGTWIHRKTKQPFALWIHEPDVYDRTHTLKNSVSFWQGTEEQFILTFEKP
jgi:hypothetical protein